MQRRVIYIYNKLNYSNFILQEGKLNKEKKRAFVLEKLESNFSFSTVKKFLLDMTDCLILID